MGLDNTGDLFTLSRHSTLGTNNVFTHSFGNPFSFKVDVESTGDILGANTVTNETDTYSSHPDAQKIITLTQAEYDAIGTPNVNTVYLTV